MIIDKENLISNGQRIADSGANLSAYAINMSVARNIAKGKPLYLVVVVDEVLAGTGTTCQIKVITATEDDLTTGQVVIVESPAIAISTLTAGRVPIVMALPPLPASGGGQQYLGVNYVTNGTIETTGKVTAFITPEPESNWY